jgi:prepilin-type processing-associated H-X9-DG protein/prepilin-type N-terminal cleavage/methylation domain-containing protein
MTVLNHSKATPAFTLVEMLTVIGILALLLAILLPTLSRARDQADRARCLNNVRQTVLAWTLYCHDNGDKLPPNVDGRFGGFTNWVAGYMNDPSDATNSQLLVDGSRSLLGPYIKAPAVFKCPADETAHVRSVSMNCRLNPTREIGVPPRWVGGEGAKFHTFKSLSDIAYADRIFVVLDENPVSINDPYFAVDMSDTGTPEGEGSAQPYFMIDYPGASHSRGATVSFADGHVEVHHWLEPSTLAGISAQKHVPPPNRDAAWLQEHCTYQ